MSRRSILHMVQAAVMTAMVFLGTIALRIPSPTGGYVNLGDVFVLLSGWVLGPWWGMAAAGLGSMLAELVGYPLYLLPSLLIKGSMALLCAFLLRKMGPKAGLPVGALLAELWMCLGYFLTASLVLGHGLAALSSVPGNLLQGVVGAVLAFALYHVLKKIPTEELSGEKPPED